jgi:entry exclusion lipoprotein TrbK
MSSKIISAFALTVALMALASCSQEPAVQPMPEVNDANCNDDKISESIKNKAMRQEFEHQCITRGTFKPSKPRAW